MCIASKDALSDRTIWMLVGAVFLCVLQIIVVVSLHDREKPESPQAVAAAAFNQLFPVKEWKPGMGSQPFMYHPAEFNQPVWHPLPQRAGPSAQMMGTGRAGPGVGN